MCKRCRWWYVGVDLVDPWNQFVFNKAQQCAMRYRETAGTEARSSEQYTWTSGDRIEWNLPKEAGESIGKNLKAGVIGWRDSKGLQGVEG